MNLSEIDLKATLVHDCERAPAFLGDYFEGDSNLNATERLMIYGIDGNTAFTLPAQMQELGFGAQAKPDVVAVTLDCAIPIADAIRGIYMAAEEPTPEIIGIKASIATSCVWDLFRGENDDLLDQAEIDRLASLVGNKNVAVVDEFVATGGTLRYAEALLNRAGAHNTSTIAGRWYQNVRERDLIYEGFTSIFADRLKEIGARAYTHYINESS